MSLRFSFACIGMLVAASLVAQTAPSSQPGQQQSATSQPQAEQSSSGSTQQAPAKAGKPEEKKQDKKGESDSGHKSRVSLGPVTVGAEFTHFSGDAFFSAYWHPFYGGPFYGGPYLWNSDFAGWGSFEPSFFDFDYAPSKGQVELKTDAKRAEVYLNGAYAGMADKLKSMWLEPGVYDLAVSTIDNQSFKQRIYVLSGKKLKVRAKVTAQEEPTQSKAEEKQ